MQSTLDQKFKERIERLNSPDYAYFKVLFRQLAVYLVSFAAGILGFYFSGLPFSEKINSSILSHFSYLFAGCEQFSDFFRAVIGCSFLDIVHLFVIFISGFTIFSFFSCVLASFYRGVSFGFSIGYLILAVANNEIAIRHFEFAFFVFVIANVIVAARIIAFSAKAVLFSYDYRAHSGKRRILGEFVLSFALELSIVIAIGFVRCLLSGIYIF